jgi:outer membrane protein TolC
MMSKLKRFLLFAAVFVTVQPLWAQPVLSLKECIDFGLANHPAIAVARNNQENARQQAREAIASYLPQVNLNANVTNNLKLQTNVIPAGVFGPEEQRITFGNKYATQAIADANQPIYNRGLLLGIRANKPNTELSTLNLEQTRQTIIYNIATAYYQILINQQQLKLLDTNRARIARLVRVSNLQAELGVAKKVDAKQVQVQLNNIESQRTVALNSIEVAQNALNNAMGIYEQDAPAIQLKDTARWLNMANAVTTPRTPFRSNQTLDYLIQDKQIELLDLQAKVLRAGNYPTLSAFAQYGFNGFGNQFREVFDRQFDFSSVGLRFSLSLFDGFRRSAQYRQALVDRDNARLNQKLSQANQNLQFLNAGSRVQRAQATLASNKANLDLASEVYENVSLQYRQGVGSLSDLLNAETSYSDAQNNYIQSMIDLYLSQLDIERANSTLETYYQQL